MIESGFHFLSVVYDAGLAVEFYLVCDRLPRQVAERQESSPVVAAAQRLGSVALLGQTQSIHEDVAVGAV